MKNANREVVANNENETSVDRNGTSAIDDEREDVDDEAEDGMKTPHQRQTLNSMRHNNKKSSKHSKVAKLPMIKKAKLAAKTEHKAKLSMEKTEKSLNLKETKIYYLPLMPTESDEKDAYIEKEFRCSFCSELCDVENLECKVCSKVFHILCLFKRGYLESVKVPLKLEWTCADCCDLSKILTDEEVRKIINMYDQLDQKKDGYVNFDDYIKIKRKIVEDNNEQFGDERLVEEIRRFKLIDSENSGFITWNEFCDFEAANLLTKKNKIELSNHLSMKELIRAKKKFLSYNQNDAQMISKKDAKDCYRNYIEQIEQKLGVGWASEHIRNCVDLLGLQMSENDKKNTAKTIWPEFIRKLTILILLDRLNSTHFKPRYWRPKPILNDNASVIYSSSYSNINSTNTNMNETEPKNQKYMPINNKQNEFNSSSNNLGAKKKLDINFAEYFKNDFSIESTDTLKSNMNQFTNEITSYNKMKLLPQIEAQKFRSDYLVPKTSEPNNLSIEQLMTQNMELVEKQANHNNFGSYHYVIRSRRLTNNSKLSNNSSEDNGLFSDDDENMHFKSNHHLKPLKSKRNLIQSHHQNPLDLNKFTNLSTNKHQIRNNKLNNENNEHDTIIKSKPPQPSYEYNKITNDIYKMFGRTKQLGSYPQQLSKLKLGKITTSTQSLDRMINLNVLNATMASNNINTSNSYTNSTVFNTTVKSHHLTESSSYLDELFSSELSNDLGSIKSARDYFQFKVAKNSKNNLTTDFNSLNKYFQKNSKDLINGIGGKVKSKEDILDVKFPAINGNTTKTSTNQFAYQNAPI